MENFAASTNKPSTTSTTTDNKTKCDQILTNAAKKTTEIINTDGELRKYINDVYTYTILLNSKPKIPCVVDPDGTLHCADLAAVKAGYQSSIKTSKTKLAIAEEKIKTQKKTMTDYENEYKALKCSEPPINMIPFPSLQ